MTTPSEPPCTYGRWHEEHQTTDPVEITRVQRDKGPDTPVYACRTCIPRPFDATAP